MNICFPHPPGSGGPGSFQIRFEQELKKKGYSITYAGEHGKPDLIFIVGGTKKLYWLWTMKQQGIPIVFRLDGINWLHKKKKVELKNYFIAESRNWMNKSIHALLADKIIYQSRFVETWWNESGWKHRENTSIIYNGVHLHEKIINNNPTPLKKRLVILEGTIDYSPYAVELINELAESLPNDITIELYGKFEFPANEDRIHSRIDYQGFLKRENVFDVLKGAVYLSLDVNPACPNTVIEAMACGAPVVAFDTGALSELVENEKSGIIVPYGSNPWDLGYPNAINLIRAIPKLFENYTMYSLNALTNVEERYSLKIMINRYLNEIEELHL